MKLNLKITIALLTSFLMIFTITLIFSSIFIYNTYNRNLFTYKQELLYTNLDNIKREKDLLFSTLKSNIDYSQIKINKDIINSINKNINFNNALFLFDNEGKLLSKLPTDKNKTQIFNLINESSIKTRFKKLLNYPDKTEFNINNYDKILESKDIFTRHLISIYFKQCEPCNKIIAFGNIFTPIHDNPHLLHQEEKNKQRISIYIVVFMIFSLLSLVIILLTLLYISKTNIIKPLHILTDKITKVSNGELEEQIQIKTNDEFEILSTLFNNMTIKLNNTLNTLKTEVEKKTITEEALIKSKEQYKRLFNNIFNGFVMAKIIVNENNYPKDYIYLMVNEAFEKMSGLTQKECLGKLATELYPNIKQDKSFNWIKEYGKVALEGYELKTERYAEHINLWVRLYAYPIGNGFFGIMVEDITQRKKEENKRHIAEKALKESEERYIALVDATSDRIFVIDKDHKYLIVNEQTANYYGVKKKDILGKKLLDFSPQLKNTTVYHCIEQALLSPTIEITFNEYNYEGNKKVWLENRFYSYSDGVLVVQRDITLRKRTENALKESEERYKTLLDSIPDNVFLVDRNMNYLAVNDKVAQTLKKPKETIIGSSIEKLYEHFGNSITYHVIEEVLTNNQKKINIEEFTLENGNAIWLENRVFPVTEGALILTRDISQRIKFEQALKESEKKFRTLFELSPDGITVSDIEGTVQYVSPKVLETFGTDSEENIVGRNLLEFIVPDEHDKAKQNIQKVIKGSKSKANRYTLIKHDGSIFYGEINSAVLYNNNNNIIGMLSTTRDVTESIKQEKEIKKLNEELEQLVRQRTYQLEQANEELEQTNKEIEIINKELMEYSNKVTMANKELESFSYSISHDLRAPLRSIDGFSSALLEDYYKSLDEKGKDYLNRIHRASKRMEKLIDDLLKLSRFTRKEMSEKKVNLSEITKEVIEELKKLEPDREVKISITPNIIVEGDPSLLHSVIENLIGNAWKFTAVRKQAHIAFGKTKINDRDTYFVKDNGIGFDMKYAEKIFGAFQRLHQQNNYPGSGIGLASVRRIISKHNGTIWAESKKDKGTTFYFTLE